MLFLSGWALDDSVNLPYPPQTEFRCGLRAAPLSVFGQRAIQALT